MGFEPLAPGNNVGQRPIQTAGLDPNRRALALRWRRSSSLGRPCASWGPTPSTPTSPWTAPSRMLGVGRLSGGALAYGPGDFSYQTCYPFPNLEVHTWPLSKRKAVFLEGLCTSMLVGGSSGRGGRVTSCIISFWRGAPLKVTAMQHVFAGQLGYIQCRVLKSQCWDFDSSDHAFVPSYVSVQMPGLASRPIFLYAFSVACKGLRQVSSVFSPVPALHQSPSNPLKKNPPSDQAREQILPGL